MFVYSTTNVGVTQRVVATLVACAVVMATIGFYNTAQAANLTNVSNTLTDSLPSVTSGHTIVFTVPASPLGSNITTGQNTTITYPTGVFTITAGAVSGATVTVGGTAVPGATVVAAGDVITVSNMAVTAGQEVVVAIPAGNITNPAAANATDGIGDSYEIAIATPTDSGNTRIVITDAVVVTAAVATQFEFQVRPVASGVTVNGELTDIGSSSTTIPFGELVVGTSAFIAQQLSVQTNAINGYVVTVEKDGELRSSTGADINTFVDGLDTLTPTAWDAPAGTLNSPDTYGHWGMTTEDGGLNNGAAADFTAANQFIAVLDTPTVVMGHTAVCDGLSTGAGTAATDDECLTEVGYKIQISSLQEAGDDYTATLTYIATPTF